MLLAAYQPIGLLSACISFYETYTRHSAPIPSKLIIYYKKRI
jgi:hypothetical protein